MNGIRRSSVLLAAAAAVVLAGCTAGSNAVSQSTGSFRFVSANKPGKINAEGSRREVGKVTGSLLNGGTFNLAADKGQVTVINFWATWCSPCTTETPQFDTVYRQYKSKGVTFVGIDTKENGRDAPRAFVKDNDISYPIVFDEEGQIAVELGKIPLLSLPSTVILDREGRVAAVYIAKLAPADLEPVLNKLVAET